MGRPCCNHRRYSYLISVSIVVTMFLVVTLLMPEGVLSDECRHTLSGPEWVTDDRGYICRKSHIDVHTGCCRTDASYLTDGALRPRHTCDSCLLDKHCCSDYEGCVACCMSPRNDDVARRGYRDRSQQSPLYTAKSYDAFRFCVTRCRTSSQSVYHQNKYKHQYHHCFG
eukprot:PhM_4_TR897/c0_g1_i1/m.78898